jgi:outer membrane protein OmpA-like peptidoglycan-associated protein
MAGIGTASADGTMRSAHHLRRRGSRGMVATALLAAMLGLSACGTWADPTMLFGDDDPPPSAATVASTPTTAGSDRFPNLARVPARPVEMTSAGERRQAVESLAADRGNARYTDEELRARPADSNAPPPTPRAPVTQLPSGPVAQPRGVVDPRSGASQPMGGAPGTAMSQGRPGLADSFSQSLAQSGANTLPSNLAQTQPGGVPGSSMPLPGSSQLLAIVRFNANESALGKDDKALVGKVAEYFKGVGGKGMVRVVSYAPPAQAALAGRRGELVSAELRRRGVAFNQIQLDSQTGSTMPAYYETAARATDQSRRVEIYLVN